jgi:hypothetical protein
VRHVLLLALTGCWTSSAPATPREAAKPTGCEIRDKNVDLAGPLQLSIGETMFASFTGEVWSASVRFDRGWRGRVETDKLVLDGEVDPDQTFVRPRDALLHDDWLVVRRASLRGLRGDGVELIAMLPDGWMPAGVGVQLRCEQLTLATAPEYEPPDDSQAIELDTEHPISVRRSPGGPIVATLTPQTNPDWPREASGLELERKGSWVHVRIDANNPIVGWVDAAVVTGERGVYGGLLGEGALDSPLVSCAERVPIFVRDGEKVVEVGHYKPHVAILVDRDGGNELSVLDGAFVRRADISDCRTRR